MSGVSALGSLVRDLLILARPRLLPYVLVLPLVGYGWAHWDRALSARGGLALLGVLVAWSLLHSGTLWLNSAVDRDEGEVLFGRAIPVPASTASWGYLALSASVLVASAASWRAGLAAAICAVLAVVYSHPATLWKGHPVFGPLVNLVGYGLLSPLAGWSVVGFPANPRTLVMWALCGCGVLGAYFLAQAFQQDEDAARGYRTLVVTHGPRVAIGVGHALIGLGFLGGTVLTVLGWLPRVCLVALPLGLWLSVWLTRWGRQPGGGDVSWANGATRRMLAAGVIGLGLNLAWYGYECTADVPVAGLGTAAGRPSDRPAWPPHAVRAWEVAQELKRQRAQAGE